MEVNLPSHGKRLMAYLIDIVPITTVVFAFYYFFMGFDEVWHAYLNNYTGAQEQETFINWRNSMRVVELIIWVIYGTAMDISEWQGTLGKRLVGIKVVDMEGNKLTLEQSLKRNTLKFFSVLILYLGVIWIFLDSNRQALHDKIANALMVLED
ncbi:MAG: RDD family protein [Bacteroidota bacterium]